MEQIEVRSTEFIAKKNDPVKCWYLIQQGTVVQRMDFSEIRLEKNSIIGLLEKEFYSCDYITAEDTVLTAFVCRNADDIKAVLSGKEKIREIFLYSAIAQRHQLLCLYADLYKKARQFHTVAGTMYDDYQNFCAKYRIEDQSLSAMEHLKPLVITHKAETWEQNNSVSIVKYMQDYIHLMEKDDSLTVGVIMEAAAQMRRFRLGIGEMESYLTYNKDILISENQNDLCRLYFDLAINMSAKKHDIAPIAEKFNFIISFAAKLNIYNNRLLNRRLVEFKEYDFDEQIDDSVAQVYKKEIDITKIDCLSMILEYAGYSIDEADEIATMVGKYRKVADTLSTESNVQQLRKKITAKFYDIYYRVFIRAMKDESSLNQVLVMFLNFGFMDSSFLSEERANELYTLCSHLDICHSSHIYTIYEWLKRIYKGKKTTSRSEFDQNFPAYLAEQVRNGNITKEQMQKDLNSPEKRVEFEIQNMFTVVNKLSYGKPTIFCPILSDLDLINSIDKMLVTAERLENELNEIRKLDYSAFYREVPFSDPANGLPNERIMVEVMPDIILMPNAGTRGMMWQETADIKSDTPARFVFPLFTSVDLSDLMITVTGQFRWEMCRKIEGVHWNDVREKSLTAEYCSYLQFYRKDRELSPEAKEKIKSSLLRARNNYREVFVLDYINWLKFESKGSFRLNKVARDIVIRHCPFVKAIRDDLKANPVYQLSINKFEGEMKKKSQRYAGLVNKYAKAGGKLEKVLTETLAYYEM